MNTITPQFVKFSQNKNYKANTNKTPQNNINKQVSFKGAPASLITEADKKLLNVFSQHYGDIGERLGQKVGKLVTSSEILKKSSRFSLEKGAFSIKEKNFGRAIAENVIFPFVNLPLYGANWVVKKAQSIPGLEEGAKKLYNKSILRIPRKLNELDTKTDIIKGIFDKTQDVVGKFAKEKGVTPEYLVQQLNKVDDNPQAKQLVAEANEYIKENLYKVSNKFFDKHTGNFNTAYERPLNRIVTGLIPVAFLANDAYNLSVLCGDSKEESKKEAAERKKQEISRVFTTAYIQLLTFGAFTKQVNTIPWFTPLTSAATVLFSEINSRRRLGKPVLFLTKEKAKEYNEKDAAKKSKAENTTNKTETAQTQKTDTSNKTQETKPTAAQQMKNISFNVAGANSEIFTSFKAATENTVKEAPKPEQKEDKKEENKKSLINFNTFKKGVIGLIGAGFALSFLKNSSYTKNTKVMKGIKSAGDYIKKKVYNPLAFKDFEISQDNFKQLTQSLKDADCKEIAEGHEFIKNKYGKEAANGMIKMYKASLSSSQIPEIVKTTLDKAAESGAKLTDKETVQIAESIKTAIGLEGTAIAEKKYSSVAQKAAEIIQNKKVNLSKDQMENITKTITESISARAKEAPVQIETKAKPFVDIVTQPFKFLMSAAKLPFKITSSLVNIVVSPVEKKAAQAALGKEELTKFEKGIHKAVTEIYGEKKAKTSKISQVIFTNAMEKLEKQTLPYRKAEAALKQAMANGQSADEIQKLQQAVDKAKQKLMVYVNTAVEKSFNGVTQSNNKNTDLAMMSKLASSAVTSAFLVADNYNMVMMKSNGEDKEGAKEKANERIVQRLSALFYQSLLINWFNATFRSTYNSSLAGMTAVAIPNTLTTELLTRKSIGMPVGKKSFEEIQEMEEKNEKRGGFIGKYFKFMRLLTGKKPLKDRLPKDKQQTAAVETPKTTNNYSEAVKNSSSTNLLEILSK